MAWSRPQRAAFTAYVDGERQRKRRIARRESGGDVIPAAAIEWEGDEATFYWTLEGDEEGYLLLEGDEA
jgi:hypothetical protein